MKTKTSAKIAANLIASANAARTPAAAEGVHLAYAVAKAEMTTIDAMRALGAIEAAKRAVRVAA